MKNKKTNSGINIKSFYGDSNYPPGEFPFTSGVYSEMYRERLWTMRQYAGFTSPEESNKRYIKLLDEGARGLSVAFDLPTQTGYDSDHSFSEGEVGKAGVPICSLADIEVLFKNINLNEVSISMTINSTAIILISFLIALAKKNDIELKNLQGTIQNDILKEYIARGTYIFPPKESMKLVTDIIEYSSINMPKWNTISISGYHIREAGANAIEELAFTLSNGIEYVNAAIERGLDPNSFGKKLSFFFNSHNHFFEEIAKFRAARKMWASIMKNRFNVTDQDAMKCRFHTQTAGSTLTAQDIDNNIVRTSLQATAAVLGGTQSLHTNAKDEALALPTDDSARLALRTQQIIAHESGIPDVVDPLAGSHYIEYLTNEIEREANLIITKIDKMGGAIKAVDSGFQQSEIAKSAFEYQMEIDKKNKVIVGVNDMVSENIQSPKIQKIDSKETKKQIDRIKEIKAIRNNEKVKICLKKIRESIKNKDNLVPIIVNAAENYCTLGEITDVLKSAYGEFK